MAGLFNNPFSVAGFNPSAPPPPQPKGLLGGISRGVNGLLGLAGGLNSAAMAVANPWAYQQMQIGRQNRERTVAALEEENKRRQDEATRKLEAEQAAARRRAQIEAELRPLIDAGDYEGASRVYARYMMPTEAKAVKGLGERPGLTIDTAAGPHGGTILSGSDGRWQYVAPPRGPARGASGAAAGGAVGPAPAKPLPTSALRIVDEAKQAIAASGESKMLVDRAIAALSDGVIDPETGKKVPVKLGAVANLESRARNFAGASDVNSRAYADIRQTLEKLRNNYLLLAKGVQTEGDAQRAWNSEIGENVQNDNALALQQLQKAQAMIDRALAAQQGRVETVYSNFGSEPPSTGGQSAGGLIPGVTKEGGYIYIGGDPGKRESWVKER